MFKLHGIRDAICKQHHVRIYQKQLKDGLEGSAVACLMFARLEVWLSHLNSTCFIHMYTYRSSTSG